MFDNFPKIRPVLPEAYKEIYLSHYHENRNGKTILYKLAQKLEAWMHRKVAGDVPFFHDKKTLEIGAGTLNHLKHESPGFYDIVEPVNDLYSSSSLFLKVRNVYADIADIGQEDKYDRIISIAALEHITDLPKVVAKSCLLLNSGGTLRVGIPNEGTFLWRMASDLSTGIAFRLKYGLNYKPLVDYEHVNSAYEIQQVLDYFYKNRSCCCFGINKSVSLYRFYESNTPDLGRAKAYLFRLSGNIPNNNTKHERRAET